MGLEALTFERFVVCGGRVGKGLNHHPQQATVILASGSNQFRVGCTAVGLGVLADAGVCGMIGRPLVVCQMPGKGRTWARMK